MDPIKLQQDIRNNQEDLQNYMRDLRTWTEQIKKKDEALTSKSTAEKNAPQKPAVSSQGSGDCKKPETRKASPPNGGQRKKMAIPVTPSEEVMKLKEAGNECLKNQKYDAAIKHYTSAMELDPNYHILYANRGMAYLKMSLFEEAEEDCGKAVSLDPQYIKGYLRRGTARLELGKLQLAKEDYQKVLKLEPHNSQAKMNIERIKLEESKQAQLKAASEKGDGQVKLQPAGKAEKENAAVKAPHLRSKKKLIKVEVMQVEKDEELESFIERGRLSPDRHEAAPDAESMESSDTPKTGSDSTHQDTTNPPSARDEDAKQASLPAEASPSKPDASPPSPPMDSSPCRAAESASLPPAARSSYEFVRDWRTLRADPERRRQYLLQIPPERFAAVFGQSLDEAVLLETLRAAEALPAAETARLLAGLGRVPRTDVLVMFMAAQEKALLQTLLQRCEEHQQDMSEVRRSFGL